MLNMIRLTALAAALLVTAVVAVVPPAAQAQPAPPAAPAAAPAPPAAAPAPAPAPAPAATSARTTEVIDNPYGLEALWKGGDLVAKTTLIILVIMSVGSWYIIITKVYEQYKMGNAGACGGQVVLDGTFRTSRCRTPEARQPVSVHRGIRPGGDQQAHRIARQRRSQRVDLDVDPARD